MLGVPSTKKGWAIVALVVALLFYIPHTRALILFILPLGRGIDDLIVFAGLFIATVLYLMHLASSQQTQDKQTRVLFLVIVGLALFVVILSILFSY